MGTTKCDLVLRFNEQNGRLTLLAVSSKKLDDILRHEYVGFIRPVAELKALDPSAAEQWVGRQVFAQLDLHSGEKIGIRDYEAVAAEELHQAIAEIEAQARGGDAAAQVQAFQVLWNAALKNSSRAELERADGYLKDAVAQAYAPALALFTQWPRLKADAERTIPKNAP